MKADSFNGCSGSSPPSDDSNEVKDQNHPTQTESSLIRPHDKAGSRPRSPENPNAQSGSSPPVRRQAIRRLGGLRYVTPPYRRPKITPQEVEDRARDAGFESEADHREWRRANGIYTPPIRSAKAIPPGAKRDRPGLVPRPRPTLETCPCPQCAAHDHPPSDVQS